MLITKAAAKKNVISGTLSWGVITVVSITALIFIFWLNKLFQQDYASQMSYLSSGIQFPAVRMMIDFGDGKKRAFEGRVIPGMRVRDAVTASAGAGEFDIIFAKNKKEIVSVAGILDLGRKQWNLYLNSNKDKTGLDNLLKTGDRVYLIYE